MKWKALLMSPTQPGTRTRRCPLDEWAYNGKDTGPSRIEKAGWRCLEIFLYQRAWQADWLRPFGVFCTPRLVFHRGSLWENSWKCRCHRTACFSLEGHGSGSSGGWWWGGGGWRTWTVCPRGTHHIQHTHTHSSLPPSPQHLLLPLERVSSSCWQRWQAQRREAVGEGGAAAVARWYICLGAPAQTSGLWSLMQPGLVKHTTSGATLWSEIHLAAYRHEERANSKTRVCAVTSSNMMTPFGRLTLRRRQVISLKRDWLLWQTWLTGITWWISQ